MKKNYLHFIVIILSIFVGGATTNAQTTINTNLSATTSTGSGGNGITFAIENTNTAAQILTDVGYYLTASHSNTVYELWMSTTSLSGPQPTAYPSAGWSLIATVTTGAITGTGAIQPLFTGLTHIIPASSVQRFALVKPNSGPQYSGAGAPNIFTAGGVNLLLGDYQIAGQNVGYAAGISNRRWAGSITFMPAVPCSGQISAGTAVASDANACSGRALTLSLNGATNAAGITYQWQSSPAGANNFTDIPGATTQSFIITNQMAATDYRCVMICTNSNTTDTSTVVSVGQNPFTECYCIPPYSTGCATYNLNSFVLVGEGTTSISDLNTGCNNTDGPGYSQRMSLFTPVDLLQDKAYPVEINTTSTVPASTRASIWIDFNNDGFFDDATERLMNEMPLQTSPNFATGIIDIPYDAPAGIHRMRVRVVYSTTGYDACSSATWGETHDYDVNILTTSCYRPLDVQLSDVTKNSVVVTVTPNPLNAPTVSYAYEVRESGEPGSGVTGLAASGVATSNPFTITGLEPLAKYKVYIRTVCSTTDLSSWKQVDDDLVMMCDYPELIIAPDVTVCGPQEVDLTAIFDSGNVYWYDTASLDSIVHTGANFRTPFLSSDTSYWVQAGDTLNGSPSEVNAARVAPNSGSSGYAATSLHYGIQFDANSAFTISSVDVYPSNTSTAGTMTVVLADNSGSIIQTAGPFALPVGTGTTIPAATAVTIPLNIDVPAAGTGYRLYTTDLSTALIRESSGLTFPYPIGSLGNVTGGWANGGPSANTYYYFYNWQIGGTGCSSDLYEVKVIVEPKPAFELSSDMVTSCSGDASELVSIITNLGGYDTFSWTPSTGVSGDAVNGWTFSVTEETDYVLSASQSNGICEHLIPVRVFASAKPTVDDTLESTYELCKNEITELKALEAISPSATIGLPVLTTGINSGMSAYVYSAPYSRQQYIYSASELAALGVDRAGYIDELSFETINSGARLISDKYTVRIKSVGNTTFASNDFDSGSGFVTVFSRKDHAHTFQGLQTMSFDIPFYWDGQSNILVEIIQEGGDTTGDNNAETYYHSVTGSNNVGIFATSTTDPVPLSGTRTGNRLNVTFGFSQSEVTWSPVSNLYLDANATIQYTVGTPASTVYVVSSGAMNQVYNATVTAPTGCVSVIPVTINVTDVITPTVSNQTFCQTTNVDNIVITGAVPGVVYTFYDSATATTPITSISQTGVYYVEGEQGRCKSARSAFSVTITNVGLPTAQFTQVICGNATVSDLVANGMSGAQIKWYDSPTSTTPLAPTHALVDNTTYYVSQHLGNCESGRVGVLVDMSSSPVSLTAQTISICGSITYGNVNLNQIAGSELVWYQSATSQQPIPNTTQVVSGTYYVSQKVNGCESLRAQIIVTSQGSVPAPTAGVQYICGSGTVAQLVAQILPNATAEWYSSATSTSPLSSSASVSSGTYYLAQRIGNCLSVKIPVAVRLTNTTAPSVNPFVLCEGATVADLSLPTPSGVSYKWYLSSSSTTELPLTDVLQTGYYFVERLENGCESSRTQVLVTINSRPSSPVGASPQTFTDYAEISYLVMNQPNVVWYATYEDAIHGINPLKQDMPLVHNTTYYAVVIGSNGCPSLPTPVEVIIVLGVNDFDLSKLNYYPNPVSDELTIDYNELITSVSVYDLTGRLVQHQSFDSETVRIHLGSLPSGTYMVNVKTKENSQFIKIVKK